MLVSVNEEGRVTIPREVRSALRITSDTPLELDYGSDAITLRPVAIGDPATTVGPSTPPDSEAEALRKRIAPQMRYFLGPRMLDDMITVVGEVMAGHRRGAVLAPVSVGEYREWMKLDRLRAVDWAGGALAARLGGTVIRHPHPEVIDAVIEIPPGLCVSGQVAVTVCDHAEEVTWGHLRDMARREQCARAYVVCATAPAPGMLRDAATEHVHYEQVEALIASGRPV
jgi:AbrB family looped-hinge helix DNA binding protein